MWVTIFIETMQVGVSVATIQVVFSTVDYAHEYSYWSYAGDCFCCSYVCDSFKKQLYIPFSNWYPFFIKLTRKHQKAYLFFLGNTFFKAGSRFLKISSIWAWNVSYKFLFTLSPKNGYLQCARFAFFFFKFQVNWTYRNGVYSLSMILPLCFDVKKTLGVKAFIDLIGLNFFFFNTLTVTFLLKHYSIKKRNFSSYVC